MIRPSSDAFENAFLKGSLSPYPGGDNFGGYFIYVETRDMGDEVHEWVDSFKNMKTGEFLRVTV